MSQMARHGDRAGISGMVFGTSPALAAVQRLCVFLSFRIIGCSRAYASQFVSVCASLTCAKARDGGKGASAAETISILDAVCPCTAAQITVLRVPRSVEGEFVEYI